MAACRISPDAALHLGPQFAVMEQAAIDHASTVAGTDRLRGVASHVMFLARGKVGPFRVETAVAAGVDGAVGVRVMVYDEGAGGRAVTAASYLFRVEAGRR